MGELIRTNEFINKVIAKLSTLDFTDKQIQNIKDILFINFKDIDLVTKETALLPFNYKDKNKDAITKFATNMKVFAHRSDRTIQQYVRATYNMLEFLQKVFNEVTFNDIEYYISCLSYTRKLSINTVDNEIKFIKPFYKWAKKQNYIDNNPFDNIDTIKRKEPTKIFLTDPELEQIFSVCETKRELAVIGFLSSTGVRVGELVKVKLSDIDFNTGTVYIFAEKTKSERHVVLNARALKYIIDYCEEINKGDIIDNDTYLFRKEKATEASRNTHIGEDRMEDIVKGVIKRANINKKITIHTFRKTLATNLLNKGCPQDVIAYTLGHKSFSTTMKYYASLDSSRALSEINKYI